MTTYLLAANHDHSEFWYGFFKGSNCYWGHWRTSIFMALEATLDFDSSEETYSQWLDNPDNRCIVLHTSRTPILFSELSTLYPELLI